MCASAMNTAAAALLARSSCISWIGREPRACTKRFSRSGRPIRRPPTCITRWASNRWACGAATIRLPPAAKMLRCCGEFCRRKRSSSVGEIFLRPALSNLYNGRLPRLGRRYRCSCTFAYTRGFQIMLNGSLAEEIRRRRTFAIISHPDAGKTTLTEKLLLFGGAIQMAGTVKGRKATRHATSDWMRLEQQRGISVTSSVMQFPFDDHIVNLLDTPGHEDFSEDTYRTLTAVDSALMVIDCAKGVEERTIKLMEVCRLRDTPIMTFVNKLDRDGRAPIELLDEIESVLKIQCTPVTWPIGMGRDLLGVYHLLEDRIYVYLAVEKGRVGSHETIEGLDGAAAREFLGDRYAQFVEEVDLVRGASPQFDLQRYLAAKQTPVFFGSAVNNFGVRELLSSFVAHSPGPQPRAALQRVVNAAEPKLSGFVFKIQANMDPGHRDRIAFMRLCSGRYARGMRLHHARLH